MPLLDHFHPPLSLRRHWESFHGFWASSIGGSLNRGALPNGYFAEMQVSLAGARVEIDVATFEEGANGITSAKEKPTGKGGVAAAMTAAWAPTSAPLEMAAAFPDELEVLVFSTEEGPELVGAIELISPRNKDRPLARRMFAIKCLSYLQQGIGVILVDVVTSRRANLHDEMARLMGRTAPRFPSRPSLYASAYRPFRKQKAERIAIWPEPLEVGKKLPILPLWLRGLSGAIPIDLESSYTQACNLGGL